MDIEITCGDEILTLAQPDNAVFNIHASTVSTNSLSYAPLTGIWTVSHPNSYIDSSSDCKITSYMLCTDAACAVDSPSTTFSVSGIALAVNISVPITSETVYLSPVTSGNVKSPNAIQIKVCGNETISVLLPAHPTEEIIEQPHVDATIVRETSTWF